VIAGLWAHEVEAEIPIGRNAIQSAPVSTGIRERLVSGVTSDAISVLDTESLARLLDERTKANDRLNKSSGIKV
jgi:hypothetical protein